MLEYFSGVGMVHPELLLAWQPSLFSFILSRPSDPSHYVLRTELRTYVIFVVQSTTKEYGKEKDNTFSWRCALISTLLHTKAKIHVGFLVTLTCKTRTSGPSGCYAAGKQAVCEHEGKPRRAKYESLFSTIKRFDPLVPSPFQHKSSSYGTKYKKRTKYPYYLEEAPVIAILQV